ncbi:DUF1176 domain-containing protein [Rhodoferax sp.]|uniref:DUF1176 domain-containing protein n=1 Tax=Rhodoferax sp. TaxID=50421 RepID=UPI0025D60743|nr:DUF1176 domain-containing protein [Rhodoferax sp.]
MHPLKPTAFLSALALCGWAQAQVFTYKDWAVACDNTRHCEAVAYQSEDSASEPVVLWLARDAGPDAPVRVQVDVEQSEDPRQLTLRLGATTLKGLVRGEDLSPAQTRQLLAHLLTGASLTLADGSKRWELSLAGSNAALLKMDDVQGRVGTPGALVRKGKKPEASVLPPLPALKVRAAELPGNGAADQALLKPILKSIAPRDCWDELPDTEEPETSITRVSKTQVLVMRECGRGAYQGGSGLWLANTKPPFAAKRLTLPMPDGEQTEDVMNASLEDARLSSYAKGRGVNDCGTSYDWVWTGKGFALTGATSAPLCRGLAGGGYSLRTYTAELAP